MNEDRERETDRQADNTWVLKTVMQNTHGWATSLW